MRQLSLSTGPFCLFLSLTPKKVSSASFPRRRLSSFVWWEPTDEFFKRKKNALGHKTKVDDELRRESEHSSFSVLLLTVLSVLFNTKAIEQVI